MAPEVPALIALTRLAIAFSHGAFDAPAAAVARHEATPLDQWLRGRHKHPSLLATSARAAGAAVLAHIDADATTATAAAPQDATPWSTTVEHQKVAGNGYVEGSPLYERQEALKAKEKKEKKTTLNEALAAGDLTAAWKALPWEYLLALFAGQLIWVLLIILVAYIYRMRKPQLSEVAPGIREAKDAWAYSLFDTAGMTGEDLQLCGMACCCPAIRWADTMSSPKVAFPEQEEWGIYKEHTGLSFWKALTMIVVLAFLGPWTLQLTTIILLGVLVYYRQKLRVIFNHSPGGRSYPHDCLILCCCTCCTIVQEAREVEKVRKPL